MFDFNSFFGKSLNTRLKTIADHIFEVIKRQSNRRCALLLTFLLFLAIVRNPDLSGDRS